jgi:hypothetical protein
MTPLQNLFPGLNLGALWGGFGGAMILGGLGRSLEGATDDRLENFFAGAFKTAGVALLIMGGAALLNSANTGVQGP